MSQKNNSVKHIYNSRKNIIFYLKNLGFDVSKYETFNIAEINAMEQNSTNEFSELDFEVFKTNDKQEIETCTIKYYIRVNIKQTILEGMVNDYYMEKNDNKQKSSLIIITLNPINDTLRKCIKQLWKRYSEYVVLMDLSCLQFNILEHTFVPPHVKLSSDEKKELYEQYNIKNDLQLPEISMFDPVAKAILLKPGGVCKITRNDKISLENVMYRICVV